MNSKQMTAALHAKALRMAKDDLLMKVNYQLQQYREQGYVVEAAPQIQRLISLDKYRLRDYERIQELSANSEKLREYIVAMDPQTGELASGERAITRYGQYKLSSIYHPPKELDVMMDRVTDTIETPFVDESVLHQFRQFIGELISSPQTAVSDDMKYALHPEWRKYNDAKLFYATNEMAKENAGNTLEIRDALETLVEREGVAEVVTRITNNYAALQEECETAAIGYRHDASMALQHVLKIFLPSDSQPGNIRHRMSDMQDAFDGQYEDYEE